MLDTRVDEINRKTKAVNALLTAQQAPFKVEVKDVFKANRGSLPAFLLNPSYTDCTCSPIIYWEPIIDVMSDIELADYFKDIFAQKAFKAEADVVDLSKKGIISNVLPRVLAEENIAEVEAHGIAYSHLEGFTDLIATYYIPADDINGSVTISREIASAADVTATELLESASVNIRSRISICTLFQAISEFICDEESCSDPGMFPLWVAGIDRGSYGAGVLAGGHEILRMMGKRIGADRFFILPSSIHEVLLLPDTADAHHSFQDLLDMVTEVNDSVVAVEEQLTDNVYHYDVATGRITHCK